ncbi:hypothetical protein RRG08_033014 [Elysia crispata]|uniref:Uncharacterized protein n=1 Tax=Elysia crispata TaxID=231223 RepID=A0AAE1CKN1_9GAST|nr:hypothetical protein RRG08_033014 [Elysia crispata]
MPSSCKHQHKDVPGASMVLWNNIMLLSNTNAFAQIGQLFREHHRKFWVLVMSQGAGQMALGDQLGTQASQEEPIQIVQLGIKNAISK